MLIYAENSIPILENIKTKILGWIANHSIKSPKTNLTPLEMRGRKWLIDKLKDESIFITKADKGGATLIMNYIDVQNAIEEELFNNNKFTKLERNENEQLAYIKDEIA